MEMKNMIIMDVRLDNFYAFRDFHMNMSYPKKIVDSYIKEEYLPERPNFRYKKVNILMGANATGKTSYGKMLMKILNFLDGKSYEDLISSICDKGRKASFSLDYIGSNQYTLYHVTCVISPTEEEQYSVSDIDVCIKSVSIGKKDSYESCMSRIEKKADEKEDNYLKELEKIKGLAWLFSYPEDYQKRLKVKIPEDGNRYIRVLTNILKSLDSSILNVTKSTEMENMYFITALDYTVIIKDGNVVNTDYLSSGTKAGIEIAGVVESILEHRNSFYYCDEKFSYIHSDIEKAILAVMIGALRAGDQLFFTSHNLDILDLPLPMHAFSFLRKDINNEQKTIECITASSLLKRNTDSLRCAVENDLFSTAPATDLIYELEDL